MRTHTCGELDDKDNSKEVVLCGWCNSRRDHGGIIFIDLRDRYGLTQIVFDPRVFKNFESAEKIRREDVVCVKGKVELRKPGMANPKLKTGKIEVFISYMDIINKAETPPLEIDDNTVANDDMRLKFRYLDLRRPVMQKHLKFRHDVVTAGREFFNKNGFLEIETPLFVKSTPEGARDYVVPSRVNMGEFYALPQSPQLYKQILMIAGTDRYYQVARCLRDEDLRSDRQPEHTQFDFEMSFVDSKDILNLVENFFRHIFKKVGGIELGEFPVFSYTEAMSRFGTDKPDIRFGLELADVTDIVTQSDFGVFKDIAQKGGIIKCINPEKDFSRKAIDKYISFCQQIGSNGMSWMRVTENGLESSVVKYFNDEIQKKLIEKISAKQGSTIFFIADKEKKCNEILAQLRTKLADDLGLIKKDEFRLCWVTDFPLFSYNEGEERWEPEHHMFSMPKKEFLDKMEEDPGKVLGDLFDITLNGVELGSGSIRISDPKIQKRVMKIIGMTDEEANEKFGFLLEAYKYGAPIHGGMGLGLDRIVALMLGFNDIREVIAFPKNKAAQCPMDGSPSQISEEQLKELHLKPDFVKKT